MSKCSGVTDPAERELPHFRARRVYLADKLRRLRERLGARPGL